MLPPATHRDEKNAVHEGPSGRYSQTTKQNESDRTQMLVELIFMFFNKE